MVIVSVLKLPVVYWERQTVVNKYSERGGTVGFGVNF